MTHYNIFYKKFNLIKPNTNCLKPFFIVDNGLQNNNLMATQSENR